MPGKRSKKPLRPLATHLLFGISTNIAAGPLGFRAELGVNPRDKKDPEPSRIVFHKTESEIQGSPVPATSTAVDIEPSTHPPRGSSGQTRQEHGPGEASGAPEQDRGDTTLGAPLIPPDAAAEAESGFGPLKTLLGTISSAYADRQGSITVRNKVEVLLPRITSLDALFATPPSDVEDLRSRSDLVRDVSGFERELQSFYRKLGTQEVTDRVPGDEVVLRLLEDIQESTLHYQMARRMMVDDRGLKLMGQAEATALNNFRCAHQAEYRHGDRNGCLKGTRSAVLDEIELWTRDFYKPPVYWLNGLAGTGKTTIAQTIAERMSAEGQLGASFFCSRDFEDRRDLKFIFPTLAVQLARTYAEFRSKFIPLVQSDPEIAYESLYGQMNKLIVQPLIKSSISTVILIDALDECRDREPSSAILSVIRHFVAKIPKVKFFVTGRPEPHIRDGFQLLLFAEATDVFVLHEVEPNRVNSDVKLFFKHNFSELRRRHKIPGDWPTDEQLGLLCERSAGLFVHAMASIRFIDRKNKNPKKQLDRLLRSSESSLEGRTEVRENITLDSLYMSILQEGFDVDDPGDGPDVRSVLGAVVLATRPLSPSVIAALLDFDTEDVFPLLSSVHSLLILHEDVDRPVRPFHKSFPDFITDPDRCTNPRFHVRPSNQHSKLLVGCLELMNRRLERNMCQLPDGVINSEVDDLKGRATQYIDRALEYACRSWHKHLVDKMPAQTVKILHQFLTEKFLFWLEVLSAIGAVREAVEALEVTTRWLNVSPTLELARDYSRFVITFFDLISISTSHIYHSALPLSPRMSMVREMYRQYARPLARVVYGLPTSWEPVIATLYHTNFSGATAWSPCNRFIAVATPRTVEIRDAVTLSLLSTFGSPPGSQALRLGFCPDGRFLTQLTFGGVLVRDLQTGGLVYPTLPSEIFHNGLHVGYSDFSSTYSMDGNMLAVVCLDRHAETTIIATHDLSASHTHLCHVSEGHIIISPIWTHDKFIRFATAKPGYITIWEVEFALTNPPRAVESLPTPDEITNPEAFQVFLFLPTLSRLGISLQDTRLVWDARDSRLLLKISPVHAYGMSFSSDGHFCACILGNTEEVHVWKESPVGYVLHQKLGFVTLDVFATPLLSPNGESIVMSFDSSVYLWHTKDPILPRNPTPTTDQRDIILGFSPNETLAAFVRDRGKTVLILDLQSGDPRLAIDTSMEVKSLGVTGSAILVVGEEKVITWNLDLEDGKANVYNSVRITTFDPSPTSCIGRPFIHTSVSPDLSRVVASGRAEGWSVGVEIYDVSTGRCLAGVTSRIDTDIFKPWFTPDGREIWGVPRRKSLVDRWEIIEDSESGVTKLQPLGTTTSPPGVLPWGSSRGYGVTRDGWILSPARRPLVWLPHRWRSGERNRTWCGRFLGLLHPELPEVVILEFLD